MQKKNKNKQTKAHYTDDYNNSILFKQSSASFSNIFACSVIWLRSSNDRCDTTEELELEADSILEEGFEEVDFEDKLLEWIELLFSLITSL